MTDIVDRLRDLAAIDNCQTSIEAADEITRLRADNERLRAALREVMDDLTLISKNHWLPVGLLDDVIYVNARAALDGQPAPGKEEA
jgi:hypothetical protein